MAAPGGASRPGVSTTIASGGAIPTDYFDIPEDGGGAIPTALPVADDAQDRDPAAREAEAREAAAREAALGKIAAAAQKQQAAFAAVSEAFAREHAEAGRAAAAWATHDAAVAAAHAALGAADPAALTRPDSALRRAFGLKRAALVASADADAAGGMLPGDQRAAQALLGTASAGAWGTSGRDDAAKLELAAAAGADVHACVYGSRDGAMDGNGACAAVHVAARNNNRAGLLFLVGACGADPNARTAEQWNTPCHMAAAKGHFEALYVLLALGADPTRANRSGYTPCMTAAHDSGSVPCLRALAAGGPGGKLDGNAKANNAINAVDSSGKTALDFAAESDHKQFAAALKKLGGKSATKKRCVVS